MAETKENKLGVSGAQATGSALAAVTSAVLLSTLGVAGTLVGAAVSSLVFTFGGVLYTRSVQAGKHHVRQAAATAKGRVQQARTTGQTLPTDSHAESAAKHEVADHALGEAQEALEEVDNAAAEQSPWRQALRGLPWKRIIFMSVGLFVVVMVAITAFELAAGRSVSSLTGGSDADGSSTTIPFSRSSTPDDDSPKDDDGNPTGDDVPAPGQGNETPGQEPAPTEQPPVEGNPEPTPDTPEPTQQAPDRSQKRQGIPDALAPE